MIDPRDALTVLAPGPATTVQDNGRPNYRRLGVPVAGTLCPDWLLLGNRMLGNADTAAALEFRVLGPSFKVEAEQLALIIAGPADMRIDAGSDQRVVTPWTSTIVQRGDTVSVGAVQHGTVALLCVAGGFDTPLVLESRATYARAGLGGLQGRTLQQGDRLPVGDASLPTCLSLEVPAVPAKEPIRVIMGPQNDHFCDASLEQFLSKEFLVTSHVDRMGMRFEGPVLRHREPGMKEIVSDGIVPGAIQVPGNGQPIVLLADGQTVGGYPKIATVISVDLPRLSRSAPGSKLRFRKVTAEEAENVLRQARAEAQLLIAKAKPVTEHAKIDLRQLYEGNLISGVVGPDHGADDGLTR